MGQYFIIVNPVKRQYIDIGGFAGENNKASGVMQGNHAIAVAVLVSKLDELNHKFGPLAGTWYGDPVIVAGDDCGKADQYGVKTSTDTAPYRNLYWMAKEEFENITYRATTMLCEGRSGFAEEMAQWAKDYSGALFDLGRTVEKVGCEALERALDEIYGSDWRAEYERVFTAPLKYDDRLVREINRHRASQ